MALRDLEGSVGIMQVLVYLYDRKGEKANVKEIVSNVKAIRESVLIDIKLLNKLGLVQDEFNRKGFPVKHEVWLTAKGVEVAQVLKKLQVSLGSGHPARLREPRSVLP